MPRQAPRGPALSLLAAAFGCKMPTPPGPMRCGDASCRPRGGAGTLRFAGRRVSRPPSAAQPYRRARGKPGGRLRHVHVYVR
jgi:hypothetical protein